MAVTLLIQLMITPAYASYTSNKVKSNKFKSPLYKMAQKTIKQNKDNIGNRP